MPLFRSGIGGEIPTSALQLIITETALERARELNRLWHSVLPDTHLSNLVRNARFVAYLASFAEIAYATAIWTSPIAGNRMSDGATVLELRRFAIANDAPRNTASRMLGIMRRMLVLKWPELTRLVSYQAVEHHAGTIYKASGWVASGKSEMEPWHPDQGRADPQLVSAKVRWERILP